MATYKVIQDIEAEDKLFGPFSLKQFIFASISAVCLYLSFYLSTKGLAFLIIFLLPPAIFFGVMAVPWSKAQPTDVWLLAKIRFFFKPRKRIWDQYGIKDLVTITVPKQLERHLTDGLSQTEIKSRLTALANTIDSRGWATKNVNVNLFAQPAYAAQSSDRLVDASTLPQDTSFSDVTATDDMMDERNNPTAQNLDRMIAQSAQDRRQQIISKMQQPAQTAPAQQQPPQDYWFMHQNDPGSVPSGMAMGSSQVVQPGISGSQGQPGGKLSSEDERALLEKIRKSKSQHNPINSHLKTIQPLSDNSASQPQPVAVANQPAPNPEPQNKDIYGLAGNDDLNVETISRIANRKDQEPPTDEVVVNLRNAS